MSTGAGSEDAQARVERLVSEQTDVMGAVVASEDGHAIAAYSRRDLPGERIAAMGSSLVGLGSTMAETVGQGSNEFVIIQNKEGYVATLRIDSRHLLTVAANSGVNLGMLLSLSRSAAEELASALKA